MRIAILDLGTNTFHLLIVSVNKKGEWRKIFKSKTVVKLGEGSDNLNVISDKAYQRGLKAMVHYKEIIDVHKPKKVFAFATSAIRSSDNGIDFVKDVFMKTEIQIEIISGDKEAEFIYYGVKQCVDLSKGKSLIMDIGGGSTEFIIADDHQIYWKYSYNIGVARLLQTIKPSDPITLDELKAVKLFLGKELKPLIEAVQLYKPDKLIGSSGSFDTFAEMIGYLFYKKNIIKGVRTYDFDFNEYQKLNERILFSTAVQRKKMKGLVKMRVDMIVMAAICTTFVLEKTKIKQLSLSKFALKEGALQVVLESLK